MTTQEDLFRIWPKQILKKNESSFFHLKWINCIQNKFHLKNGPRKWKFKNHENRRNWREDYRKRDFQKYSVSSSSLKSHAGGWSLWRPSDLILILIEIFLVHKRLYSFFRQCRLTGNYENNGIYTIYNPGTFIDNSCRERKVDFTL